MIINAITQIRDKTTNATQDQIEFKRRKEKQQEIENENRNGITKTILNK